MRIEEMCDLAKSFFRLGNEGPQELCVALALEDLQDGVDPCLPELAMRSHRVAQDQVARTGRQNRGREAAEIAKDRRQFRIAGIVRSGVKRGCGADPTGT